MELKQAIVERHAVRSYSPRAVDERSLRLLLEAAIRAPSGRNEQPWSFVVIQNRKQLMRYAEQARVLLAATASEHESAASRALLRGNVDVFHGAGTLIVICGNRSDAFAEADCWLAAENLMLTACDQGLGSCPVGSALPLLNSRSVKAELSIPDDVAAIAPVVVGFADEPVRRSTPRAAPKIWSFWR